MYIMSALLFEICKNTEWVWEGSSYVWRNTKVFQYIILVWPHYWSHPTNRELRFHSNAWWTWHKIWVAFNFKFKSRDFYKSITTTVGRPNTHKKRLNLTPVKHGYTLERHPMKKNKKGVSKQKTHQENWKLVWETKLLKIYPLSNHQKLNNLRKWFLPTKRHIAL